MSRAARSPARLLRAAAPVRICDNGGWTDTWFARHGCVFNLAVTPCVEVDVQLVPGDARPAPLVTIHAQNFGPPYKRRARDDGGEGRGGDGRREMVGGRARGEGHARGARARSRTRSRPDRGDDRRRVRRASAAARSRLSYPRLLRCPAGRVHRHLRINNGRAPRRLDARGRRARGAPAIAAAAHRVETDRLGRQSGIQDQLAAAFGGASFIEMEAYPHARVTPLPLDDDLRWELDARLSLIALGRAHESSAIHERVIAELADRGPEAPPLQLLRRAATAARDALIACDLAALGRALADNTEAQATLHANLVSAEARRVIAIAREHGALGWKVNGAGGDGGSIAVLGGPSLAAVRAMRLAIAADLPATHLVPMRISMDGLRVSEPRDTPIDIL